jgi:hypothetical protein
MDKVKIPVDEATEEFTRNARKQFVAFIDEQLPNLPKGSLFCGIIKIAALHLGFSRTELSTVCRVGLRAFNHWYTRRNAVFPRDQRRIVLWLRDFVQREIDNACN